MNLLQDLDRRINAAGLKWTHVCQRAGVSTGTPTHWREGRTAPTQTTYDKLCKAIDEMIAERCEEMRKAGLLGKKK